MTIKKNKTATLYIKKEGVALDGGTVEDVFTVAGGPIMVTFLGVEVTEAVSNNPCNVGFTNDPTAGAGTDTPITSVALDIAQAAIGDWLYIENDASAMIKAALGTAVPQMGDSGVGVVVPIGGIDLELQNSNPSSGIGTVWMAYIPIDNNSRVS